MLSVLNGAPVYPGYQRQRQSPNKSKSPDTETAKVNETEEDCNLKAAENGTWGQRWVKVRQTGFLCVCRRIQRNILMAKLQAARSKNKGNKKKPQVAQNQKC